jgi:septal ring factor EnvC (AmiA/AmiB activator)
MPGLLLAALFLAILPGKIFAQSVEELQSVQQELETSRKAAEELAEKAATLGREVADLQSALILAAADVQRREREVSEIENTLASLSETESEKAAALKSGRGNLAATLVALQRLSAMPRQALLFGSQRPVDMARSARLLSYVTPVLDGRARALQSELNEIHGLRQEMALKRDDLTLALSHLASQNQRLADLVTRKSGLQQSTLAQTEATRQRLARLADQARNLQDLISRLEQTEAGSPTEAGDAAANEPEAGRVLESAGEVASLQPGPDPAGMKKPASLPAFPEEMASLTAPVSGQLVREFGATTETAGTMKGVEVETRPGAQVVATFDGQIVFEGPFRSYGQILIIEHPGGYHTILAGLDHVSVRVGQWLKAGEPIGRMGASDQLDSESGSGRPRLYLEMRHDGQPFDPAPIFVASNSN